MLKFRLEGFSESLPYKAVEAFRLTSSPWADRGQRGRREGRRKVGKEGRRKGERKRETCT